MKIPLPDRPLHLAPYWASRLNKNKMNARQLSTQGGELTVELKEDRTILSGRCHLHRRANTSVNKNLNYNL